MTTVDVEAPAAFSVGVHVGQDGSCQIVLPTYDSNQMSDFLSDLLLDDQTRPAIQRLDGRDSRKAILKLWDTANPREFDEAIRDRLANRYGDVDFYDPVLESQPA